MKDFNSEKITTCQHIVSDEVIEAVTNASLLIERLMKAQGIPPYKIAMAIKSISHQAGIELPDCFVKKPTNEKCSFVQEVE